MTRSPRTRRPRTRLRSGALAGAFVTALVSAACASGGGTGDGMSEARHVDAMSPGGEQCYQFERNAAADRLGLPWGFVRTHEMLSGEGASATHRAWTLNGPDARENFPFAVWRHVDGGIQLDPELTGSISVRLTPDGPTRMTGSGRFIGDAVALGQEIDRTPVEGVVAHQVLCGAEPGQPGSAASR